MLIKLYIVIHIFIIGCITVEVGVFLRKLDENLSTKLSKANLYNSSQLFQDIAAYSFNIARLLRLFKLKREQIMDTAKWFHNMEQPVFIRNFSCEKVKSDFQLSEREYKNLLNYMEKIKKSLSDFYVACGENPKFIGHPLPKQMFSLEKHAVLLETMFRQPDPNIKSYKLLKTAEDYYYTLGKFTKKFILGRQAVMERAKALFESRGPAFLKCYNLFRIKKDYKMSFSEAATLVNIISKIKKRYRQFTRACFENPNFESKMDLSTVCIIQNCEHRLCEILATPLVNQTDQLFKHVRHFYHVLGYLRRYNISHKSELLNSLFQIFGPDGPVILRPIDFERLKNDFKLDEENGLKFREYIGHLKRRYNQVHQVFLYSKYSATSKQTLNNCSSA